MTNTICGVLRKKKKFYFSFNISEKILTIQPDKMNLMPSLFAESDFDDFPYLKDTIDLEGETNLGTYIRFINVKFSSIGRGCFQAWVPAYILGCSNGFYPIVKPNQINKLVFKGECIDRFMSSKCIASDTLDRDNYKLQVNIDYGKDKIKKFYYDDIEFELVPGWTMTTNQKDVNKLLTVETSLVINSKKRLNIKSVMKLYEKIEKLFSFVCYRRHVEFNSIELSQITPIKYIDTPQDTTIRFELYISKDDDNYDLPKIGKNMVLKDFTDKIPSLIKCLNEDEFMLLSLPSNSLTAPIIDNNRYISISSTFESEFDLLNPKFKSTRKKNYNDAKVATLKYLNNQKNNARFNSQIRGYFGDLYNFIDRCEGRLEEQIIHELKEYSYIVEPERKFFANKYPTFDFSNNSLARAFVNKRDNLSHGSKLEKFKRVEIVSYSIIRKINYAMILERAGFDKKQIQEIVRQVL